MPNPKISFFQWYDNAEVMYKYLEEGIFFASRLFPDEGKVLTMKISFGNDLPHDLKILFP